MKQFGFGFHYAPTLLALGGKSDELRAVVTKRITGALNNVRCKLCVWVEHVPWACCT